MVFSSKLVERYRILKVEGGSSILLMQVGSFMQVMGDDARVLAEAAGLKLKMAGEVDAPVVVGGFPVSGLDAYVGKLVRNGHSVAIAMQRGEPKERFIVETISIAGLPSVLPTSGQA
ncbi:MAG: hypothetical protein HQL63_12895 [Magnetococcales bacterium]|nr:hypothetical protein [Magnetococcales bacterium]